MLFTPIKPMLATMGNEAFDDNDYIFEPKWDGIRLLLHKQGSRIEAYTRSGLQVTAKFPELLKARHAIQSDTAILDCEAIVLRDGKHFFDDCAYRRRLSQILKIKRAEATHPAVFVAFDVLYSERSLLHEPLLWRKQKLGEMITTTEVLTSTLSVTGQGKALYESTHTMGMEGIVAKHKESSYTPAIASPQWVKIKHPRQIDVIILGYRTEPFCFVVGLNFRTVANKQVGVVMEGIREADKLLFLKASKGLLKEKDNQTQWLVPHICCRIQYRDRTDTHQLRMTEFQSFLWEQRPEACTWGGDDSPTS